MTGAGFGECTQVAVKGMDWRGRRRRRPLQYIRERGSVCGGHILKKEMVVMRTVWQKLPLCIS